MDQHPLPFRIALVAVARCVVRSAALIGRGAVRQPREAVGRRVTFADGTSARIYRETVIGHRPADPCALVVEFRLRGVRGWGHPVFRAESVLNTPLFVGFPGFVSKWWLAHDENGVYRGFYEWDGPERAASYARALWWVLMLVCVRSSIRWVVLPGARRDDLVDAANRFTLTREDDRWRRPVTVA
ncbi:MAG TPA: hypothetical protein VH442_14395 [Micromonosporaceae bacterium]